MVATVAGNQPEGSPRELIGIRSAGAPVCGGWLMTAGANALTAGPVTPAGPGAASPEQQLSTGSMDGGCYRIAPAPLSVWRCHWKDSISRNLAQHTIRGCRLSAKPRWRCF